MFIVILCVRHDISTKTNFKEKMDWLKELCCNHKMELYVTIKIKENALKKT